jgi:triosephosphate isomerase
MRKPMIAGNWKMNTTISEAENLVNTIKAGVHQIDGVDIVVCPPYVALHAVSKIVDRSANIQIGAQNMYKAIEGAYTGEISPMMIKEIGCRYVILGHSERRQYFKETDALINEKVKLALQYNLMPIVWIGETLQEREANTWKAVIEKQTKGTLAGLKSADMENIIIAYEPVWAIGTGKTASPEQAEEVHAYIRGLLSTMFDKQVAQATRILYGGSAKPDNIVDLVKKENIDGGLIGGAALKAESFIQLVTSTKEVYDSLK